MVAQTTSAMWTRFRTGPSSKRSAAVDGEECGQAIRPQRHLGFVRIRGQFNGARKNLIRPCRPIRPDRQLAVAKISFPHTFASIWITRSLITPPLPQPPAQNERAEISPVVWESSPAPRDGCPPWDH